ncbi:hypothetical protein F5Y17DRAFT_465277 [Xylariaceae sp. FL0594]|nr:hypothetical protein F5Y17DRAFT_465277 [Xylariaceae sp. FL0594]
MAPGLNVSAGAHPKVMIVPPRLNLRRAASYQGEKAPSSSTSSRFSFNHLLFSPPPSPGLPALVPRPRKPSSAPRPSRVLRILVWVTSIATVFMLLKRIVQGETPVAITRWNVADRPGYDIPFQNELPDAPTPIAVTDAQGRSRWTVSIPPLSNFPLPVKDYSEICSRCQEVASHVRELHGQSKLSQESSLDYYYEDPYFMDVREAEKWGLLPGLEGRAWTSAAQAQDSHLLGQKMDGQTGMETCRTSLTFVLETLDAGLGPTLMMLWTAYGLAQKENRAFFIEDSRWAYGKYTDMFKSPPLQDCKPPPRHQMLPCPRSAKHLVVSAATASVTFGDGFVARYEDPKRRDIGRERSVYDLARIGYEALFLLNGDDEPYVRNRVKELRAKAKVPQGNYNDGMIIGVHVRQGDLHPFEYQYNGAYIPLEQYAKKAVELIDDRHNFSTPLGGEDVVAKQHSFTVVASDNPDVYEADELLNSYRAQEQIKLAGKQRVESPKPDRSVMHKFVDEAFGWEGGFFASMFWNLGHSTFHNADAVGTVSQEAKESSADVIRLRSLIGRAYMMDLAVLGQVSDSIICTMSATGCRLLAVMMGWDKAMAHGNWVNIDGDFMWTGIAL